jgi:hypothetical protein
MFWSYMGEGQAAGHSLIFGILRITVTLHLFLWAPASVSRAFVFAGISEERSQRGWSTSMHARSNYTKGYKD